MHVPLTYEETLRTLGTLLDEVGAESAVIAVDRAAARVQAPAWPDEREWSMAAVEMLAETQRAWRTQPAPPRLGVSGLRHRLRVVGRLLDRQDYASYVVVAQPTTIEIESPAGRELTVGARTLDVLAAAAVARRGRTARGN